MLKSLSECIPKNSVTPKISLDRESCIGKHVFPTQDIKLPKKLVLLEVLFYFDDLWMALLFKSQIWIYIQKEAKYIIHKKIKAAHKNISFEDICVI